MTETAIIVTLLLMVVSAIPSRAQTVFVETGGNMGVGITHSRGNECFVITSAHVLGSEQTVNVVGFKGVQESAVLARSYSDDIAILRVKQQSSPLCNEKSDWLDAVAPADNRYRHLEIEGSNGDGSLRILDATLSSVDDRYIFLTATGQGQDVFQGMSGSLITAEGHPIGLLAEVHKASLGDVARGYRLDYLKSVLATFFSTDLNDQFSEFYGNWVEIEPDQVIRREPCEQLVQTRYLLALQKAGSRDGKLYGRVTRIVTWTQQNEKCSFPDNRPSLINQFYFTIVITPLSKSKFNAHTEYVDCDGLGCSWGGVRTQDATLTPNSADEIRIEGFLGASVLKRM